MTGLTTVRLAALLGGLLLVVAAIFARVVQPGARPVPAETPAATASQPGTAAPTAAQLFDEACGACHTAASLSERLRGAPDPGALTARFETFLRDHGDTSDEEDRQILDWLSRPR